MLTIVVQELLETVVLRCTGRIVYIEGTDILRRTAFAQQEANLLIDMRRVTSIDASGLGALVELQHWTHESGRKLKVRNPSACVREVFRLTGLISLLEISDGQSCTGAKLASREFERTTAAKSR